MQLKSQQIAKGASFFILFSLSIFLLSCDKETGDNQTQKQAAKSIGQEQTPKWSADDREFFLHGSMSTEVYPVKVLRALFATYPELFPDDFFLQHSGATLDRDSTLRMGFSRTKVKHLGGLSSLGINCASCHTRLCPVNIKA